jgi:hypothetical protein
LRAARQTSSASVSDARPSPSAMRISEPRASRRAAACGSRSPRPREQLLDRGAIERLNTSTRARDSKRGVELERRVLGRGADQHHGAVSITGRKLILLRAVEAVHLVDEEQRPLPGLAPARAGLEGFLQVRDAGEHRGELLEMQRGGIGQQPRDRGLARCPAAPRRSASRASASPACG